MEQSDLLLDGLILAVNSGNIKFDNFDTDSFRAIHNLFKFRIYKSSDDENTLGSFNYMLQIVECDSKVIEAMFYSESDKTIKGNSKIKTLYSCIEENDGSILSNAIYEINKLNRK